MQLSIYINYLPDGKSDGTLLYEVEQFNASFNIKMRKEKSHFIIECLEDSNLDKMLLPLIEKNALLIKKEYERLADKYQDHKTYDMLESPAPVKKLGMWEDAITTYNTYPCKDSRNLIKVCVDKKRADIEGRIYTMYSNKPVVFCSLDKMLMWIDNFLDFLCYPIATIQTIGFQDNKVRDSGKGLKEMPKFELSNDMGKRATFIIKVIHRQNASWQGTISWYEERKQRQFHSALELIRLIDSVTEEYDTDITDDLDLSDEPKIGYSAPDESDCEVVLSSINTGTTR